MYNDARYRQATPGPRIAPRATIVPRRPNRQNPRRGEEYPIESIHVPIRVLVDFAAGELGEIRRARVCAHTRCCDECARLLREVVDRMTLASERPDGEFPVPDPTTPRDIAEIDRHIARVLARRSAHAGMRPWVASRLGRLTVGPSLMLAVATLVWWAGPTRRVVARHDDVHGPVAAAVARTAERTGLRLPGYDENVATEATPSRAELRAAIGLLAERYRMGSADIRESAGLVAGLLEAGRVAEAVDFAVSTRARNPSSPEALVIEAVARWVAGQRDRSVELLRRAQQLRPDDPIVHYDLAVATAATAASAERR